LGEYKKFCCVKSQRLKRDHISSNESLRMTKKTHAKGINDPRYHRRMNDPTISASLTGPCGDTMEFYLVIEQGKIQQASYFTDGCQATMACGAMAAILAEGKTIEQALKISAGDVVSHLKGLPGEYLHCSILSVSTFYRAMADYLLRK
jgi:nitrogen fixation protein NifU and related proteins